MAAAVDENLFTVLTAKLPDDVPVEQDKVSELQGQTRVWFRRSGETTDTYLNGSEGPTETSFDIECCSTDIALAQGMATTLKSPVARGGLNGFYGAFGTMTVMGVFVEDHDDQYTPKNLDSDDGFHVAALKVKVIFDGSV